MSNTTTTTLEEAGFPPVLHLPHELLFEILSLISDTSDLLSVALSCRTLCAHVVPHHIDYRVLHIRTLNPILFTHLARRTDLARNIREVHISEKHNYARGDRHPARLVEMASDGNPMLNGAGIPGSEGERIKVLNVCKAFRSMSSLKSFTWEWNGVYHQDQGVGGSQQRCVVKPTSEPRFENAILAEVVRKPTLRHFSLSGPFGLHVDGPSVEGKYEYPIWHLSNLTSLELSGDAWLKVGNILPMCVMLSRSPNIEYLSIPLEFKHLPVISFPKLKRAKLQLLAGATNNVDASATVFIHNHPGLEELSWYPIGTPTLRKGCLPNLKRLKSTVGVIKALAEADGREEQEEEPITIPVIQPQPTPPPATVLSVPTSKPSKRLSVIREADEPEDSLDEEPDSDGEATPSARPPLSLDDDDAYGPPPSAEEDGSAQYASYSPTQSTPSSPSISLPTITLTAPPSTPTSCVLQQTSRRQIESLDILSLPASLLLSTAHQCMDRTAVREVTIHTFGEFQELIDIAEMFPNIRWLSLPAIHLPQSSPHPLPWTIDDVIDIFPRFKQLEVFRGGALWRAAGSNTEEGKRKVHETLNTLVQLCPNLKEVDHCDWYERRGGFKRVVVERRLVTVPAGDDAAEVEQVEQISYGVRRPFVRRFFDTLGGSFA